MRSIFTLFFSVIAFCTYAQAPFNGEDSVRNIRWENDITMFFATTDGNDSLVPSKYVRTEFDLVESDRIVLMLCGKKELVGTVDNMSVPKQFLYKIKTPPNSDSFAITFASIGIVPDSVMHPDSIVQVDMKGLEQFYIDKKDSLKIDTLQLSADKVFDLDEFSNYPDKINECSYKYNRKDGIERGYYKTSELKDVCITDHFRLKYEGHWKKGKKQGKWKEYDKSGKLVSVKKYKHDKLAKQKDY
jgi:hypothetical protein